MLGHVQCLYKVYIDAFDPKWWHLYIYIYKKTYLYVILRRCSQPKDQGTHLASICVPCHLPQLKIRCY